MSIPTPLGLRNARRRHDRRWEGVEFVLQAMRQGAALHLHFQNGRPIWSLSTGLFVHKDVAVEVIAHVDITTCGDALFLETRAQTFRYVNPREATK